MLAAVGDGDHSGLLPARQMQALSLGWHIVIVCFGITFPALVVFAEGLWLRTRDPVYRELAMRWSKVMLILFAVGAVSGTILSFELGILWPEFMATFGDVFGLAFALEGFSFFIEAIFIAIYVYGWNRLPERVHFAAGLPMIAAGLTGAFFVISVNAWMNNPTGFDVVDGRVTNVDPWATLTNDAVWHSLVHMVLAGYIVAGFLTAAVYAVAWLRGDRSRHVRAAFVIPFTVAALTAPAQLVVGDWAASFVAEEQPTKLAAMEGLSETKEGAPFTVGGWYTGGEVKFGLEIPRLLSLLAFHDPNAEVASLDRVAEDDRPPINFVRVSFQTMVAIGTGLTALAALYLLTWWRFRRLPRSPWFYRAAAVAGPASVIALIAGWIVTEVGRQPWIVYEVMRTEEAVTDASGVRVWFVVVIVVYAALTVGTAWALRRFAQRERGLRPTVPEAVPGGVE